MFGVGKEYTCSSCIHRDVCFYKDTFCNVQEQISSLIVSVPEGKSRVDVIPFVSSVGLECKYYGNETKSLIDRRYR